MRINEDQDPIITTDFHCDLFKHDCIAPESLVCPEDARRVREAMAVIDEFERTLIESELLEEL
jgi:hypothetical protein